MKHTLEYAEFYITNVCNLGCNNCNRFNNFYFKGHQHWESYFDIYEKWSERVDIKEIVILGGEPTLNPSLKDWCIGLRKCWPNASIILLSNGSRINKLHWLYETMQKHNIKLEITAHGKSRYPLLYKEIKDFLTPPINEKYDSNYSDWLGAYKRVKDPSWPDCDSMEDYESLPEWIKSECRNLHNIDKETFEADRNKLHLHFDDSNGVVVTLSFAESFVSAPLKFNGEHDISVYNSRREKAHSVCISKYSPHFIDGRLYKCHHVALLPKFMEQFEVNITKTQNHLLNKYKPATIDFTEQQLDTFLKNLKHSIPQCSLCPENLDNYELTGKEPKPKLKRRDVEQKVIQFKGK